MAKILFEDDGGGGGDYATGGDPGISSMGMSGGYGGGGYGSVGDFYKTFVEPFKTVIGAFGYGTEKIVKSLYFFAKKILLNIPRLFNPLTPLIFDDIRDEEKAAYASLDQRYAEILKSINEGMQNRDLKAIAFMLYPSQVLGAKLLQKGPGFAYNTANALTGGALARIKQVYDSLPAQERSRQRVAELIRQEQEAARSASDMASSRRGYSLEEVVRILTEQQQAEQPQQEDPGKFFKMIMDINPQFIQDALTSFSAATQAAGNQAINEIISKAEKNIEKIKKVAKSKNLDEFCEASGLDKNIILQEIETQTENALKTEIEKAIKKAKKDEKKEPPTPQKIKDLEEELKPIIKEQIKNQVFNALKTDYMQKQELEKVKSIFRPFLEDQNIPENTKAKIKTLIQNI